VAYASDVSGTSEVYVRPFRESGATWRVSNRGGQTPNWKGDGREIYYLAPDGMLMAARVTGAAPFQTEAAAPKPTPGAPAKQQPSPEPPKGMISSRSPGLLPTLRQV